MKIFILFCFMLFFIYQTYSFLYFKNYNFKQIKSNIKNHIENYNKLNLHMEELKSSFLGIKSYDYGISNLIDTSNYNFKRKYWNENIKDNRIHLCSASVCKNAYNNPFKYLCKYFNIKKNEKTLSTFENLLNNYNAVEEGKILLQKERDSILKNIKDSIPAIIYIFQKKLIKELGFTNIDFSDLYFPVYRFQYVSAGGNSSIKCDIKLDIDNLEKFVNYLSTIIKVQKTIKGQRVLMTSKLREKIKIRDNYTCKLCGLSIKDEKHLLLEIDHIIPLSKGGITSEDNLQTLCWKCNRSKSSKIYN